MTWISINGYQDMDTKVHDVILNLDLEPIYWQDEPEVRIEFNSKVLHAGSIAAPISFRWLRPVQADNRLSVWLLNKREGDTQGDRDKAIKISKLGLEDLFFDSILYRSRYRPQYSAGYHEHARTHGLSMDPEIYSSYLGFNGEWFLDFTWPVFGWIYDVETQGQGWVYEKTI